MDIRVSPLAGDRVLLTPTSLGGAMFIAEAGLPAGVLDVDREWADRILAYAEDVGLEIVHVPVAPWEVAR